MLKELIPNIEDLISDKEIKQLEALLNSILQSNVIDGTNRIGNKLELSKPTDEIVKKSLKEFYNSKQYKNSVAKYLINVRNLSDVKEKLYSKDGMTIDKASISESQKLAISEHLAYLEESGLNASFNQPLRQLIYSNIGQGISQSGLENKLKEYISGGNDKSGKLSRYVKQVAINGADAYTSILDQKITDKYYDKITGYIVTGSLIETSSPQCKYCVKDLNRLITKDDFEEIKKRSVGLIEGTTFKNLPTLKLHFGCRHTFTPKLT
jgi:hypothetical protein